MTVVPLHGQHLFQKELARIYGKIFTVGKWFSFKCLQSMKELQGRLRTVALLYVAHEAIMFAHDYVAGPYHEDMRRQAYFDRMYQDYERYDYDRR